MHLYKKPVISLYPQLLFSNKCVLCRLQSKMMQPDWLEHAMDRVCPKVGELLQAFNSGTDPTLKKEALADEIMTMLREANLAYYATPPWASVWVSKFNRWTGMLDTTDLHDLLDLIVQHKGWSWLAVVKARAYEYDPKEMPDELEDNLKLVRNSNGMIAPIDKHAVSPILTVACSHAAALNRAILAGCVGKNPDYCVNGRLNKELIIQQTPSMAEPLSKGMQFEVVRAPVMKRCPGLALFLQSAGNADHGTARAQTKSQLLMQIYTMAQGSKEVSAEGKADWRYVLAHMMSSNPESSESLKDMCEFVERWSFGTVRACHRSVSRVPL